MKINKKQLEQMIREAVEAKLKEDYFDDELGPPSASDREKDKLQTLMFRPAEKFLKGYYHWKGHASDEVQPEKMAYEKFLELEDLIVAAMEKFHL